VVADGKAQPAATAVGVAWDAEERLDADDNDVWRAAWAGVAQGDAGSLSVGAGNGIEEELAGDGWAEPYQVVGVLSEPAAICGHDLLVDGGEFGVVAVEDRGLPL
jgi:hypothetical protein